MNRRLLCVVVTCVVILLAFVAGFLISGVLAEKEPDRSVHYDGSVLKMQGEVLFVSKHENGYVIYMDQREYQPNCLTEFWVHDETNLFDDENGEHIRKLLEEQQTGWIALIGSYDLQDNILEGHSVRPVLFIYDKTPAE